MASRLLSELPLFRVVEVSAVADHQQPWMADDEPTWMYLWRVCGCACPIPLELVTNSQQASLEQYRKLPLFLSHLVAAQVQVQYMLPALWCTAVNHWAHVWVVGI